MLFNNLLNGILFMKKIDSQSAVVSASPRKLYDFISDFNNFENFLPEQVTNWKATQDACSFNVPNLGEIALRMERYPAVLEIKYIGAAGPASFELLFEMKEAADEQTDLTISTSVEAAAFIMMMIGKPIRNFVAILLDKIKQLTERDFV